MNNIIISENGIDPRGRVRRMAALLAALLAFSAFVTSCGGNGDNVTEDGTATTTAEETTADPDALEVKDLGGITIRAAGQANDARQTFAKDEENGELVNDALIKRDKYVRDTYNVNLEFFLDQELEKSITQQVLANDCEFDFMIGTMRTMMQNMTLSGLLSDLNTLPYLSLEDVWWCRGAADNLHIRDSLYFTAGPITPQFYFSPYAMAYNKRLAEAYQMPEIEKLVENGEWTIDKFASLLKNTAKDLDGDNKIGKDDQLGLAFDNMVGVGFPVAAGIKTSEYDSDGLPVVNMNSERTLDIISKLRVIFGDKENCFNGESVETGFDNKIFVQGRAIFNTHTMSNMIATFREMEDDYGIIPCPKFDEAQESYYSYSNPWCMIGVAVPVTCADKDTTAYVMEAMARKSYELVRPAQYDMTLKQKVLRDSDAELMLDLIYDNVVYDLNGVFDFGGSASVLEKAIKQGADFTSAYAKIEEKTKTEIAKFVETMNK